jgi:hypothetical protein
MTGTTWANFSSAELCPFFFGGRTSLSLRPGAYRGSVAAINKREFQMRRFILISITIALFSISVLADTKSDYDRSYDFSKLRTWDFKIITRMPEDPVGTNTIWNGRIRSGLENHLAQIGYRKVSDGAPDFLVTYFMGIKEKYDIRYIDYVGHPKVCQYLILSAKS